MDEAQPRQQLISERDQEIKEALMKTCEQVIDLVIRKRHDYGTLNMKITGRRGLAIRMLDKASRLLTLSDVAVPQVSESLSDTYKDLIGYALIGMHGEYWELDDE